MSRHGRRALHYPTDDYRLQPVAEAAEPLTAPRLVTRAQYLHEDEDADYPNTGVVTPELPPPPPTPADGEAMDAFATGIAARDKEAGQILATLREHPYLDIDLKDRT